MPQLLCLGKESTRRQRAPTPCCTGQPTLSAGTLPDGHPQYGPSGQGQGLCLGGGGGVQKRRRHVLSCCICMCIFSDESLIIEVGESFETVTNGVALLKEIQNGCLQLDSAATGCSNHIHKDVYKLLASQLESRNSNWSNKK